MYTQCLSPLTIWRDSLLPMLTIVNISTSLASKAPSVVSVTSCSGRVSCRPIMTGVLNLDETTAIIEQAAAEGKDVARLQCGDPALYGAIGEQMRRLDAASIDYEVIPGVSAVAASAAMLKKELTLSGVSQTVVMTRYEGKTPFPERERLPQLAQSGATLAIHLGVTRIHKIVEELIPHYGADCPVAVCYRTSWPDQDFVTGTLADIVAKVRAKKFTRTSLILVGRVLDCHDFADSYLYDKSQAHIYRQFVEPFFGLRRTCIIFTVQWASA